MRTARFATADRVAMPHSKITEPCETAITHGDGEKSNTVAEKWVNNYGKDQDA